MSGNIFGKQFRLVTWGESHGPAIGGVVEGCPAGLELSLEAIQKDLDARAPGSSEYVSPRKESDNLVILSGVFEGKTTGAPIAFQIPNKDGDSSKYDALRNVFRPGHANYSYLQKYGIFDHRGGGRASARETAARVVGGAVARSFLKNYGIQIQSQLVEVGGIRLEGPWKENQQLLDLILLCKDQGDSLGGLVETEVLGLPAGLGDPIFDRLEARLAQAMLSIPATKGFEIGSGFACTKMRGSKHNDAFFKEGGQVRCRSNHAGGTLGGISTGMPLVFRVPYKPTSSINQTQESLDVEGRPCEVKLPKGSRHDPCVCLRAPPIQSAMTALVLADALLLQRSAKAVLEEQ